MIKSMTGFGEATVQIDSVAYTIEVRTVNNRHLKTHIRLPDAVAFLGDTIEKFLRSSVSRGTVNFSVRMQNNTVQGVYDLNESVLVDYINKLKSVADKASVKAKIDMSGLVTLPGVVQPIVPTDQQAEAIEEHFLNAAKAAVDNLKNMRAEEGKALAKDLLANCAEMRNKLDLVATRVPDVIKKYHAKLKSRVDDLLSEAQLKLDEELLAREVAIFAERSDIAEELTRLSCHIEQFELHCNGNDNAGRKLDFISQEMLREANTIASKACDSDISCHVIDIKCAIDRIKEQVQNVE